ncbi:MAG: DUF4398 domain-containing protein [Nitrospirales bacterium]|nr:DUF4398 domain-containing protein [Nitrospirales bacterium]
MALFCLSVLLTGCQDPPIHELQKARQAVEHARREGALTFAPDLYSLAESELTIGEEEFHEQSRKMFWARDYSMATRLIMLAQTDAQQALSLAQEEKQKSSMSEQRFSTSSFSPPPPRGASPDQRRHFLPGPGKEKWS